jgi:hypothetical protein
MRVSLALLAPIIQRIDSEKGDVSRSRYVLRLLEKAYGEESQRV